MTNAWAEFMAIYEPLMYQLARQRGLQDADARELAQEVFVAVTSAIERWQPDPERAKFRTWLFRIARNLIVHALAAASETRKGPETLTFVLSSRNSRRRTAGIRGCSTRSIDGSCWPGRLTGCVASSTKPPGKLFG
jgi:RNA polymerase sigma factor (sigma-70 family)